MTASNAEIFQTSAQQAHLLQASGGQVLAARLWLRWTPSPPSRRCGRPWPQLCERHEILRTRYVQVPGLKHPAQEIHAQVNLRVRHAASAEQARLQVAEDLGQAPLAASLAGRNLLLGVALASADPAALRLLGDELQALLRGEALAEFDALQYADYAAWQGDLAQESIGQQGRAFWRGLLAEQARLPCAVRAPRGAGRGAVRRATGHPVADALAKLAEAGRISTDEALAVLWAAFLVELGQPASVVLGLEVSGRNEQLEQTVGHFARQLPLVLAIDSSRGLRATGLARAVAPGPVLARLPGRNRPGRSPAAGLRLWLSRRGRAAEQDWPLGQKLLLRAEQRGQGLALRLVSPARVFDAAQLQAWLAQFASSPQVAANLDQPLCQLNGVDSAQAEQLLQRFDRSAERVELPGETLHGLFEQAAKATPGHTALQVGAQALDYASLDQRANGLAQALRERGVGPDSVVAVYGERSVEIVVTLLAILKAGGAYLPLDPSYPAERLAFMLHDARAQCLITLRPLADGIEVPDGVARLALEQGLPAAQAQAPAVTLAPGNLAYVIYTSGSTGKPRA
jgi:hypothetical protein